MLTFIYYFMGGQVIPNDHFQNARNLNSMLFIPWFQFSFDQIVVRSLCSVLFLQTNLADNINYIELLF